MENIEKERCFEFMSKHITYNYLKNLHVERQRIVVSRYGDGEHDLIIGKKHKRNRIAKQSISEKLTGLLNYSIQKKGQLICLPAKIKITPTNLKEKEGIKFSDVLSRHLIKITDHSLYGQGQWRMIDLIRNNSDFISNFFLDKTLIVTGHKEAAEIAFRNMSQVDVYETLLDNACSKYETVNEEVISLCRKYKNIIFGCGPLSKILIANLISECDSNLIDLGSVIGIIVNPFSSGIPSVRRWSGFGKKGDKKVVEKCSINFFETLRRKIYANKS